MFEKTCIIGNVGKDAEMKYTPTGQAVTSFSVAVNKEYTDKSGNKVKKTKWYRVTVWGSLAEICSQYVRKGMTVYCEGELQSDDNGNPRVYTKQDGTAASNFELTAQIVRFLSKSEKTQPAENAELGDYPDDAKF